MRATSSRPMRSVPVSWSTTMPLRMSSVSGLACRIEPATASTFCAQRLAGLPGGFAADAGRARGPGAAAVGRVVGVADDDAHALDRHAERRRDALRDHGFGALALLGDAGVAEDRAGRVEPHGGAVLRRDAGAADAVERGARIGHLDERREADAAIDALLAQALLLGAQPGVVHHRVEMRQRRVMRQLLELDAGRALRRDARRRRSDCAAGSPAGPCRSSAAARSTRPSVTAVAIGWPTARYWHITFLFWNTTRARAR